MNALRAFKGIKTLTAATIVAEIGDLKRFPSAGKFASFLGLTAADLPAEVDALRGEALIEAFLADASDFVTRTRQSSPGRRAPG